MINKLACAPTNEDQLTQRSMLARQRRTRLLVCSLRTNHWTSSLQPLANSTASAVAAVTSATGGKAGKANKGAAAVSNSTASVSTAAANSTAAATGKKGGKVSHGGIG
jgi:hypothetical protein